MENKILHGSTVPESFLKIFGYTYKDKVSKVELVIEANKIAKANITTLDSSETQSIVGDKITKLGEFFGEYK